LLQEEGIAKGIRRITAITMGDAIAAKKSGEDFAAKVKAAGELKGLELENEVKVLSVELNNITMSAVVKSEMRDLLGEYGKAVVAWKKEAAAARSGEITSQLIEMAEKVEGDKFVCQIDFGLNGKLAKTVSTAYGKKVKDKAFLLITADKDADKYMAIAFAPKQCKSVDCKAWVTAATEGTGGKGGGKKDSAQFTISGLSSIESVLEKAKTF